MNTQAQALLINKTLAAAEKALANVELIRKFSNTLSRTCWASTSSKIVFECRCPQCKEIVSELRTTGKAPEYC
jgi:hypothetical protein